MDYDLSKIQMSYFSYNVFQIKKKTSPSSSNSQLMQNACNTKVTLDVENTI